MQTERCMSYKHDLWNLIPFVIYAVLKVAPAELRTSLLIQRAPVETSCQINIFTPMPHNCRKAPLVVENQRMALTQQKRLLSSAALCQKELYFDFGEIQSPLHPYERLQETFARAATRPRARLAH